MRPALKAPVVLTALTLLLYGMTLTAPVFYDDLSHVQNAALSAPEALKAAFSPRYFELASERTYQPLVTILHALTGPRPVLYRLLGLLLHALASYGLFRLGGWGAALLFCVFPASTETVFFASFKGHLLAAVAAIFCVEAFQKKEHRKAAAFLFLALLSKETGLCAAVLCGLQWLAARRSGKIGYVAGLSAAYLVWRFWYLNPPPAFPETFSHSGIQSLGWYLKMLVWPSPLCLEHGAVAGLIWIPIFAALAAYNRTILWIPAALLPFLHVIPFANLSPVADRYLYLPAAGWCLFLSETFSKGSRRLVLAVLFTLWGGMTAARNGLFRDERGVFEQTAACAPDNPRAHYLCGLARLKDEDPRGAAVSFARALELRDSANTRSMLELSLQQIKKKPAAP
jgi:hypothetical protein